MRARSPARPRLRVAAAACAAVVLAEVALAAWLGGGMAHALEYALRAPCGASDAFWAGAAGGRWVRALGGQSEFVRERLAAREYRGGAAVPEGACAADQTATVALEYHPEVCRLEDELWGRRALEVLGGRRVVFVGDSLGRQHALSLDRLLEPYSTRFSGFGDRWTFRAEYEGGVAVEYVADLVDAVQIDPMGPGDVFVVNQGAHGLTPRLAQIMTEAKEKTAAAGAQLFWRETGPTHFRTSTAEYEAGVRHGCVPGPPLDVAFAGSPNAATTPMMESLGIPILRVFEPSYPLWDAHMDRGGVDCRHYCQPGVVDLWTLMLLSGIESGRGLIVA